MTYESGMQVIYDVLKKGVFVEFRGRSHYLEGPFQNQREAVQAAEELCRTLGWQIDQQT